MEKGHNDGWFSYLKQIGIGFVISLAMFWVFEHVLSKEVLEQIQTDGAASLEKLQPFALASDYLDYLRNGSKIAREEQERREAEAYKRSYDECMAERVRSELDCRMAAWFARPGMNIPNPGAPPATPPPSGPTAGLQIGVILIAALFGVLADAFAHSWTSFIFLSIQTLIGAAVTFILLVERHMNPIMKVFLFPLGTVAVASIAALPLLFLMHAAVFLLGRLSDLVGLASQCTFAGVTLWKLVEIFLENVTHHSISKRS
jgi:hypothetical protein